MTESKDNVIRSVYLFIYPLVHRITQKVVDILGGNFQGKFVLGVQQLISILGPQLYWAGVPKG